MKLYLGLGPSARCGAGKSEAALRTKTKFEIRFQQPPVLLYMQVKQHHGGLDSGCIVWIRRELHTHIWFVQQGNFCAAADMFECNIPVRLIRHSSSNISSMLIPFRISQIF